MGSTEHAHTLGRVSDRLSSGRRLSRSSDLYRTLGVLVGECSRRSFVWLLDIGTVLDDTLGSRTRRFPEPGRKVLGWH